MSKNNLHEISKRSIPLCKYHMPTLNSHDYILTATSEKGLHFFDFAYNLNSADKAIDIVESIILTPKDSPAQSLFPKEVMCREIPSLAFNQMIIDQSFWPHSELLMQNSIVSASEWSPKDFIHNKQCVVAMLNNIGCVEMYTQQGFRWVSILNLSSVVAEQLNDQLPKLKDLEQVKTAVKMVETSSICWSPKLNEDNSCYFVTCQKNGDILFWSLNTQGTEITATFCGRISCELGEAIAIKWIWLCAKKFIILYSNIFGELSGKICTFTSNNIEILQTNTIWKHKDRMTITNLNYEIVDDKVILVYSKYRHLVVQMLNWELDSLSQCIENVNDNKICFISKDNCTFVMSTMNVKMYEIVLKLTGSEVNFSLLPINVKDSYKTFELYGAKFSKNKVLLTVVMQNRQVLVRKENYTIDVVFMGNSEIDTEAAAQILINNQSQKLSDYWDCIEFLRYKCMKHRKLPALDYSQLYNESSGLYSLKVYNILLCIYHLLVTMLRTEGKALLPELSLVVVKERIFLHQANSIINRLQNKKSCTSFELDSLDGAEKYVDYYCRRYEKDINIVCPNLRIKKEKKEFICQCCDETVEGFLCKNAHVNMYCSLTFTPIEGDDYLMCKSCGLLARIELLGSKPECVLCDLPLNNCYLPT